MAGKVVVKSDESWSGFKTRISCCQTTLWGFQSFDVVELNHTALKVRTIKEAQTVATISHAVWLSERFWRVFQHSEFSNSSEKQGNNTSSVCLHGSVSGWMFKPAAPLDSVWSFYNIQRTQMSSSISRSVWTVQEHKTQQWSVGQLCVLQPAEDHLFVWADITLQEHVCSCMWGALPVIYNTFGISGIHSICMISGRPARTKRSDSIDASRLGRT